jgi:hypothetical protein
MGLGYEYSKWEDVDSQGIHIVKSQGISIIPGISMELVFSIIKTGIKYGSYVMIYRTNNPNQGLFTSSDEYEKYQTKFSTPEHVISVYLGINI